MDDRYLRSDQEPWAQSLRRKRLSLFGRSTPDFKNQEPAAPTVSRSTAAGPRTTGQPSLPRQGTLLSEPRRRRADVTDNIRQAALESRRTTVALDSTDQSTFSSRRTMRGSTDVEAVPALQREHFQTEEECGFCIDMIDDEPSAHDRRRPALHSKKEHFDSLSLRACDTHRVSTRTCISIDALIY